MEGKTIDPNEAFGRLVGGFNDQIAALQAENEAMREFVAAYDEWAQSDERWYGPLCTRMFEARAKLNL